MKRACVLVFLPLVLFGLETVNLIKNHSFEKEDDVWETYTGTRQPVEDDSAQANAHDPEVAFTGLFSASNDTRFRPGGGISAGFIDSAVVIQGFSYPKTIADIDDICWRMTTIWQEVGFQASYMLAIGFLFDAAEANWINGFYFFHGPNTSTGGTGPHRKVFDFELTDDTLWIEWERSFNEDWVTTLGLSPNSTIDSIMVVGYGFKPLGQWYGQKVYWDDIRLMGYADYDVGVKEILSGDSLEVGTPYQPVVRIKNFGRENADSFLVMAEIWDGSSLIYSDTLPWTLEGDTEDTVIFADFDPPTTGPYTLTVRTFMTPDECDEDDEVSKEIGHSAIEEKLTPDGLSLKVRSVASPLYVSYSLPYGEHGILTVYDATGRRIERMEVTRSGSVEFGSALVSGVYLVRLESKQATVTKKAVVLR